MPSPKIESSDEFLSRMMGITVCKCAGKPGLTRLVGMAYVDPEFHVECVLCGTTGPRLKNRDDAVRAWEAMQLIS